jgi:hypothetical protein
VQVLKKSMLMCQKNCKHIQLTKTVNSDREQTHCFVREGTPVLHKYSVLNLRLIYGLYRDFGSDFDLRISTLEVVEARWFQLLDRMKTARNLVTCKHNNFKLLSRRVMTETLSLHPQY